MIVATPNETKFYVTNTVSGSVSVVDRSTGEAKVIVTGPGKEGIAISPDGKEVWAASRTDAKISIIATATDTIVASFPSGGKSPKRMDFTPDGSEVWVTNSGSGETTVFDARARELLAEHQFHIAYIDAIVIVEKPKLGPYFPAMREALAKSLGISTSAINLKAKTNEGVDAIGRGEAIAAQVIVTLER